MGYMYCFVSIAEYLVSLSSFLPNTEHRRNFARGHGLSSLNFPPLGRGAGNMIKYLLSEINKRERSQAILGEIALTS